MRSSVLERLFIIILLLTAMGAIDALTRPPAQRSNPEAQSTDVPLSTSVIVTSVYAYGGALILLRWKRVFKAANAVWPLILFTCLAPMSLLWSNDPWLTVRRSVFVILSTLLGVYIGQRFSMEQIARMVMQAMCCMMLASIAMYFVAPAYVLDQKDLHYLGAWEGLTPTKNSFGGYMAVATVLFLLLKPRRHRWLQAGLLVMAAVLLLLARSATSLVTCAIVVAALPLWHAGGRSGRRRLVYAASICSLGTIALYLAWANYPLLLQLLGRDVTLTGRTKLWSLVWGAIEKRPLFGYGYGAFWTGSNGEARYIWFAGGWPAMGADNGYLDHLLGFGAFGFIILFFVLAFAFWKSYQYLNVNRELLGMWPISYVLFFALHNMCESHLLTTRSLHYLLLTALITAAVLGRQAVSVSSPAWIPVGPQQVVYGEEPAGTSKRRY